jgi:hypothetical protein
MERTGQGVANAAQYVRSLQPGSLTQGARRFARSHPAWFWGGAFVTGLALARLLKATPPDQPPSDLALREKPTDTWMHASSDEGGFT